MKVLILFCSILLLTSGTPSTSYRDEQKTYTRVREAYASKEKIVLKNLSEHGILRDSMQLYMRAFKTEKVLELWAKNNGDSAFILIKKIPICDMSGEIGPKRRYKDLQVPEGFYRISSYNPFSKYYLSMQINYPNASDSIRGYKGSLGNYIFIHGDCISSGCLAINNEYIKELFVYCIEAINSGQKEIGITIFPTHLTEANYTRLTKGYSKNKDFTSLWADLLKGYKQFNQTKIPPVVTFLPDGSHEVK